MFNRHVVNLLSSYLDGQLTDRVRLQVQSHLDECTSCKQEEERLKLLSETLKTWQSPQASEHFDQAVRDKIVLLELEKGAQKMDKKTFRILISSGVVAGLLVLMLFNAVTHKAMPGRVRALMEEVVGGGGMVGEKMSDATDRNEFQKTVSYEPYYLSSAAQRAGSRKMETTKLETDFFKQAELAHASPARAQYGSSQSSSVFQNVPNAPAPVQEAEMGEGAVIVIQSSLPATGVGEKIIRSAMVRLEVEDGKDVYGKLAAVCREAGGYLASSTLGKDEDERTSGQLTMRIPKDKFEDVLESIRGFGQARDFSTDSRDVSQEYKNLRAHLETSMILYNRILQALKEKKNTIPDIIRTESELTPVQERIEELKNQIEALDNSVSFTTITVSFFEPQVSDKILKQSGRYIHESFIGMSVNFVKSFARVLPALLPLTVLIAVVLLAVAWVGGWIRKTWKKN